MSKQQIKDQIAQAISFAIQGVQETPAVNTGDPLKNVEEYYKTRNKWVDVETDRIYEIFTQVFNAFTLEPVDMAAKFERPPAQPVDIHFDLMHPERTAKQIDYLIAYSVDSGYNAAAAQLKAMKGEILK